MRAIKIFSVIFSVICSLLITVSFALQVAPSCNALSDSESYSTTQGEDTDAINIKDGKRIFVSSFVVNGIDLGAGYFYDNETMNGYYRFIDESGEETICHKVDSYTIDTEKQQEEDERHMQAVKDQINESDEEEQITESEDYNSIEKSLLSIAGSLSLGVLAIFAIFFICFTILSDR